LHNFIEEMKSNSSLEEFIIIQPNGGLANRMRVIASGLWLQRILDRKILCVWHENQSLGAQFHDLFEDIEEIIFNPQMGLYKYIRDPSEVIWWKKMISRIINKYEGIDLVVNDNYIEKMIHTRKVEIIEIARQNRYIYFNTCYEFGGNFTEVNRFIPVQIIRDKIDQVCERFTAHTVGIHIRRTDNIVSIEYSPIELFEQQMNFEIAQNEQVNFFLSTDDLVVEKYFLNKFGSRIITHQKELSRQSIVGIQDAIVDMYCLAKTLRIFGSYWSSFNYMASRLGKIKVEQLKKNNT